MTSPVNPTQAVAWRLMVALALRTRDEARVFLRAAVAAQFPRLSPQDVRALLDAFADHRTSGEDIYHRDPETDGPRGQAPPRRGGVRTNLDETEPGR